MLHLIPKNPFECPYLFLAPMEGVGDRAFRRAIASIGGFDEAVTEFLSVPINAHVQSLAKVYQAGELSPIPLAAQIMGSDPYLMAAMAQELESRGAPRIDINCGCPSNTVTGRGAGSSLLKDPLFLHTLAKLVVQSVSIPVTMKMRSGYEDISLFKENIVAAQESGIAFVTLHPRTKIDGYSAPAKWELIALAKELLHIPVIGNGDILSVSDALSMLTTCQCDALMIGRGAVMNPFLFHQIKAHFSKSPFTPTWDMLEHCLLLYLKNLPKELSERGKIGKLKQFMNFLFRSNPTLFLRRQEMLQLQITEPSTFLQQVLPLLQRDFFISQENLL